MWYMTSILWYFELASSLRVKFYKSNVIICGIGRRFLKYFELASGLWLKFYKSNVMNVILDSSFLPMTIHLFNCKVGSVPFRYLELFILGINVC